MTVQPVKRSAYTEWFMGDHKGAAPPIEPDEKPDHLHGESIHLNGMDVVVRQIHELREEIGECLDPKWITRDDQFGVLLQLHDDLTEAINELLRIGWPADRKDGKTVWESAGPPGRPEPGRAELTAIARQLKNGVQGTLI